MCLENDICHGHDRRSGWWEHDWNCCALSKRCCWRFSKGCCCALANLADSSKRWEAGRWKWWRWQAGCSHGHQLLNQCTIFFRRGANQRLDQIGHLCHVAAAAAVRRVMLLLLLHVVGAAGAPTAPPLVAKSTWPIVVAFAGECF